MDPDETLRNFWSACSQAQFAADGGSNDAEIEALRNATEAAATLFSWISQGGYTPNWKSNGGQVGTLWSEEGT